MKLTYFYAKCLDDSGCYNIRARTKKAAKKLLESMPTYAHGPIVKVTIEYRNAFDLLFKVTGDGSVYEESTAHYEAVDKLGDKS